MAFIIWTDKYSVGCNYIDDQHKKLIDIINKLHDSFLYKKERDVLGAVLNDLVDYTKYHFSAEEKMLEEHGHGPSEEHKQQHKEFVDKLIIFQKRHELGDDVLGLDLMNFLRDWLLNHILVTDKQYSEAVCSKVD